MSSTAHADHLDREIHMTHERFVTAMEARLPTIPPDSKERYFGVLSLLVAKLETGGKPLREILQEMMTEAATMILHEMQP
jgi:hypothetical protein